MYLTAPRLLPWASWDEWRACYDIVERVSAGGPGASVLSRIAAAWSLRGRTPLAAASTLALLGVLRGGENEGSLGLLLVRLVNGITDSAQKGVVASSVSDLARRIGFPRWVVDLRHDLSHGTAPDVAVLRLAAAHSIQWLLARYWRTQAAALATTTGAHMAPAIAAALGAVASAPAVRSVVAPRRRAGPNASPRDSPRASPRAGNGGDSAGSGGGRPDVRLLVFSRGALRAVNASCGGDASNLVVDADTAAAAKAALRTFAASPLSLFEAAVGTPIAPLVALARAAMSTPAAGYEWIDTALVGPLVRAPGWLLNPLPLSPASPLSPMSMPMPHQQQQNSGGAGGGIGSNTPFAPRSSPLLPRSSSTPLLPPAFTSFEQSAPAPRFSILPSARAPFEPNFRAWLPLLVSLELSVRGFTRLLTRALALVAADVEGDAVRAAAADAWLWLFRSRYWHSFSDWSLLAAPRKRGTSGAGVGSAADVVHIVLHARSAWNADEASWAFAAAPEACLLGLERSASGSVTVNLDAVIAHYLPRAAPQVAPDWDRGVEAAAWREFVSTDWYERALRAPVATASTSPFAGQEVLLPVASVSSTSSAPSSPHGLDLDALERLLDSGVGAQSAGGNGHDQLLPKRPRWSI